MKAVDVCRGRAPTAARPFISAVKAGPSGPRAGRALPPELNGPMVRHQGNGGPTLEGCGWRRGGAGESSLSWRRGFPVLSGCRRLRPASWKSACPLGLGRAGELECCFSACRAHTLIRLGECHHQPCGLHRAFCAPSGAQQAGPWEGPLASKLTDELDLLCARGTRGCVALFLYVLRVVSAI